MPVERALSRNRAADRLAGAREREEERISLRVDLASARAAELLAQDPAMVVQHLAVRLAEVADELRRPFDVGEEERDGTCRKLALHGRDSTSLG